MTNAKERVALSSIFASGLLTALKLTVDILSGSLGILSEAAHSALDCGATMLTYAAIRISGKPADHDHPYGHGKVESIAALAETALLFLTSAYIIYAASHRLIYGGVEVEPRWSAGRRLGARWTLREARIADGTKACAALWIPAGRISGASWTEWTFLTHNCAEPAASAREVEVSLTQRIASTARESSG